ncbi:hypothetical protein WAI453_006231 [Rhynchosporium graminicola]|uniref:Protein kinase domain-containing protein n=1 Tax=Rhynchosporium graminicola TaxID=2792576 RepID=A0A1E1L9R1_9HELO|nr:uncharacterized protein RCO7_03355 [Rhynchosporium commune]
MIEFIGAITRGHDHYLLLWWVDGVKLSGFWQANTRPQLSVSLIRDVDEQLYGLADALKFTEEDGYCHGDLKPENFFVSNLDPYHVALGLILTWASSKLLT